MCISRGGTGGQFLSNTGPDPLKNHKATKSEFSVGHHRHAAKLHLNSILMIAYLKWHLDPHSPHQLKKKKGRNWAPITKLAGSAHVLLQGRPRSSCFHRRSLIWISTVYLGRLAGELYSVQNFRTFTISTDKKLQQL